MIKAGDAMGSHMVHQLMGMMDPVMPPKPKPPLSQTDQKTIQDWINAGCQESTFGSQVKPIFDHYCNTCHSPGVSAGGISFGSYELLKPHIEFPQPH